MEDYKVIQGATLPLAVKVDTDEEPLTATIFLKKTVGGAVEYTGTGNFVNGIADITIQADDTDGLDVGEYLYQITVVYDGTPAPVDKFPDEDECDDGECEFPKITICEKLG